YSAQLRPEARVRRPVSVPELLHSDRCSPARCRARARNAHSSVRAARPLAVAPLPRRVSLRVVERAHSCSAPLRNQAPAAQPRPAEGPHQRNLLACGSMPPGDSALESTHGEDEAPLPLRTLLDPCGPGDHRPLRDDSELPETPGRYATHFGIVRVLH